MSNWWNRNVGTLAFVSLILLTVVGFWRLDHEAQDRDEAIRDSQVRVCKDGLEPGGVRFEMAEQIREQVEQSKLLPPEFFPGIPRDVFEQLVREQNAKRQARIANLLGVDCEALYPKPD